MCTKTMVKADIAEELDEAIQPWCWIQKITLSNHALFIDKTGCNMPTNAEELEGRASSSQKKLWMWRTKQCINYTVLASSTTVLCVIIYLSGLPIEEFPISWKTGINIAGNIDDDAAKMCGGPTCILPLLFWLRCPSTLTDLQCTTTSYIAIHFYFSTDTTVEWCCSSWSTSTRRRISVLSALEFHMQLINGRLIMIELTKKEKKYMKY